MFRKRHIEIETATLDDGKSESASSASQSLTKDEDKWLRIPLTAEPVELDISKPWTGHVSLTIKDWNYTAV